jgi:hypothetical protein
MTIIASSAAIAVTLQKICRSVGVAVALFDGSHGTHWRLMVISLRPIDKRK